MAGETATAPEMAPDPDWIEISAKLGVTFPAEMAAAGVLGPFNIGWSLEAGHVDVAADCPADLLARIKAVIAAHDPTLTAPPVNLAAYAKTARDAKEVGGITVAGVPIATDDRSKILISGARDRALDDPSGSEAWSATDGKTYVLPAAAILALSKAVGAHVSEVFKTYADVMAHLAATPPTITSTAEIDAEFAAMPVAY